jgi:hypothetical protein
VRLGPARHRRARRRRLLRHADPDFSLYPDWPIAAQLWNTYRSRWLGRYWQQGGLPVIPTVNWSDQRSFPFCVDGIETGQLLSIGTADCRHAHV